MNPDSGRTTSLWMDTASTPVYPSLTENTSTDVCVIGAGIAGLTTAYLLALYWDTEDPYHYARLQPAADDESHDILIVGGEDHKTGQESDMQARFDRLERWTREHFVDVADFPYHWSGQVMEPADLLAFIGRNPGDKNVYICYTEWLRPMDGESPQDLKAGEGFVMRRKTHLVAVYRDEKGALHEMSAVCPHLKCIVHWNALEKSWDCPCHGSRFDAYDEVFAGPAVSSLGPAEPDRDEPDRT